MSQQGDHNRDHQHSSGPRNPEEASRRSSPVSSESDSEKAECPKSALDWIGPDDKDNPQNWPTWRKWFQVSIASGIAFVGTFASSAFSPGFELAASEFHVGRELGVLAFSIYVLGLGMGGPIASPLSETLGRKYVYLTNMPVFALFILGTGFSNNIVALIFTRLLAGFFGAPSLSIGSATVSDMFTPEKRSRAMTLYVMTPYFGPALGPLVGGFVTTSKGWRWTSWVILFATVLVLAPALLIRETYKKTILQKRAKRLGIQGPSKMGEGRSTSETVRVFVRSTLIRPLHMLFTEPVVGSFCFYVAYNFALSYSFFTAFPYVFESIYGYSRNITGLTFLGLAVGCLFATIIIELFNRYFYLPKARAAKEEGFDAENATSRLTPENRLYMGMMGGPMITAGLFLFGWSATYRVHWIAPVVGEVLFGTGNQLVFMTATTYIMDVYGPLYGASAMAGNSMLRYTLAAIFPLFSIQMFEGMGTQYACTLLGCVAAVGMCIPFVLFKWGPGFRARSTYKHGN